jgi:flagellar hook-associated protein 3 FlgL
MRVTAANSLDRSIETLQQRQQSLVEAQDRLTSGKKIARPSDDPTGAARVERALAREARADASQRALEASRNAMVQAESAMGQSGDLAQRARELLLAAGNPTYDDTQRKAAANELRGLREQVLQIANRGDGAGGWLFGAQGAAQPPFIDAPGGVQFRGTQGLLVAASGEPLPLTADGAAVFLQGAAGNGVFVTEPAAGNSPGAWIDAGRVTDPSAVTGDSYSVVFSVSPGSTTYAVLRNGAPTAVTSAPYQSGQAIEFDGLALAVSGTPANGDRFEATPAARDLSIFDALARAADALSQPNRSGAQITQAVQTGLRDLDASIAAMSAERARMGEVLNRTDAVEARIGDSKLLAQSERSAAEDLDMVQAVSDFSAKQTSYDAALKAYSMVQKLSLFEYIR